MAHPPDSPSAPLGRRAFLAGSGVSAAAALTRAKAATPQRDGLLVAAGTGRLRITALTDEILQVTAWVGGQSPACNPWAVLPEWRQRSVAVRPAPDGFATASLRVSLARAPLHLSIADTAGRVLAADAPGQPLSFRADGGFEVWQAAPPGRRYFGLGDKPGALDRRGRAFGNWNTDAYAWQESSDPLYRSLPFFLAVDADGSAHGVFLDTTWRSHVDFGVARPDAIGFGAAGGCAVWYVIAGPHPKQVLERYTALTGRMELPPAWALGFQQSRWSYPTAGRVRAVVASYRAAGIPLDAIWLDIGYQDRNRPFTVDQTAFPDLSELVRELAGQGVRVVAIADPHIADAPNQGYAPYNEGIAGDRFVRTARGELFVGKVWPGPALFPDFADADVRAWWGTLFGPLWCGAEVAGIWNDMNEPTVFDGPAKSFPLDARHRIREPGVPERLATHREVHNAYGLLNARATADGLRKLAPQRRPFVLTRASAAGGQRDAALWTGDNSSTWNHLRLSVPQLCNLGLSGFPLVGADVGGFRGSPPPDLLTRWIQIAAFTPFMRDHTEAGTADQEAYVGDPAQVAVRRAAIAERYALMPYLYALAEEAARTGVPMMRPMALEFPGFAAAPDHQFLLGPALLVAPPPDEGEGAYELVLPPGTAWFDWWTGHPAADGATLRPYAERLPVFARAGCIVPRQPAVMSTAQAPEGMLELRIYPGRDAAGAIYADDGVTRGGSWLRQSVAARAAPDGLRITVGSPQGAWRPWWSGFAIAVFGRARAPRSATVPVAFDVGADAVRFTLPSAGGTAVLRG